MSDIERYADKSMYPAAPMQSLTPKVHLLSMTADPLGAVAAACRMYEGKPTYDLSLVTDEERRHYWAQMQKTHLNAPLEFIDMHFFIEGVTRAFTHQMVRQRTAVYAQESLRFAVKEDISNEVAKPPSLSDPGRNQSGNNDLNDVWDGAVGAIDRAYRELIANGVPAEDARGLLPHAITTRLNYKTNLRNLIDHAGNRLCTQAQFEWRSFFLSLMDSVRNYVPSYGDFSDAGHAWQFELIADTVFVPACYQMGHCPFNADFDRGCTIRSRVEEFASRGVPSSLWDGEQARNEGTNILREEWLSDPKAAWQ